MTYETLLVDVREGVASVTLNRPDVRNALSATLIRELEEALTALEADPAARVIVLAGAGDKAFCAGADLGRGRSGHDAYRRRGLRRLARILERARMRTPLIAKAWHALAGGWGSRPMRYRGRGRDAVFGCEIKIGLLPLIVMAPILRSVGRAWHADDPRGRAGERARGL